MVSHSAIKRIQSLTRWTILIVVTGSTAYALSKPAKRSFTRKGKGRSINYVENKTYLAECAPCHLGFLPGFLPARSWRQLMNGLADHFGEDASLDDEPRQEILKFLIRNAADHKSASRRSKKIAKLIEPDQAPLRITETAFWQRRHGSVRAWVWKRPSVQSKAKCSACHRDAEKGIFDEYDVDIPED